MGVNLESRHLYRLHRQQPVSPWSPAPHALNGDRPVRICTLGRFTVQVDNRALARSSSSHQRPLEML